MHKNTRKLVVPAVLSVLALAACQSSPTAVEEPSAHQGVIVGRLESSVSAMASLAQSYTTASTSAGTTVAVARVQADGALETLARASAAADGSYRIEGVPTEIDRLVVVATSGSGAELGRAIVHQALSAGSPSTVAPVNGETTVEAAVFTELVRSGMPKEVINTVELAQSIEVSGKSTADALVRSATELRALADGVRARQDAYTAVLSARGVNLDARARFEASLPAAASYAQERHTGADEKAAEATLRASVADAYKSKGADARVQAEASGAAETALLRAAEVASASARLDVARAAHTANLLAREGLIVEMLTALGVPSARREEARQALAAARTAVEGAGTAEEMSQAAAQGSARAQAAFEAHVSENDRIPALAQERLKAALQNLPSQADLSARLGGSASGSEVARAYVSFLNDLRTAVQNAVGQVAAAGGSMDGRAVADLFTGLRASVQTK